MTRQLVRTLRHITRHNLSNLRAAHTTGLFESTPQDVLVSAAPRIAPLVPAAARVDLLDAVSEFIQRSKWRRDEHLAKELFQAYELCESQNGNVVASRQFLMDLLVRYLVYARFSEPLYVFLMQKVTSKHEHAHEHAHEVAVSPETLELAIFSLLSCNEETRAMNLAKLAVSNNYRLTARLWNYMLQKNVELGARDNKTLFWTWHKVAFEARSTFIEESLLVKIIQRFAQNGRIQLMHMVKRYIDKNEIRSAQVHRAYFLAFMNVLAQEEGFKPVWFRLLKSYTVLKDTYGLDNLAVQDFPSVVNDLTRYLAQHGPQNVYSQAINRTRAADADTEYFLHTPNEQLARLFQEMVREACRRGGFRFSV